MIKQISIKQTDDKQGLIIKYTSSGNLDASGKSYAESEFVMMKNKAFEFIHNDCYSANKYKIRLYCFGESFDIHEAIRDFLVTINDNLKLIHLGHFDAWVLIDTNDKVLNIEVPEYHLRYAIGRHGSNIKEIANRYDLKNRINIKQHKDEGKLNA